MDRTVSASAGGGLSSATPAYDLDADADSATFDFVFSGRIDSDQIGDFGTIQFISDRSLSLTVDGDDPWTYELSGFLNTQGEGQILSLDVNFLDITNTVCSPPPFVVCFSPPVYRASHRSSNETDSAFVLGSDTANDLNRRQGELSGTLTPGVTYEFSYNYFLQDDNNSPVTLDGGLRLALSRVESPTTVPLPASALMLLGAAAALARAARGRRS